MNILYAFVGPDFPQDRDRIYHKSSGLCETFCKDKDGNISIIRDWGLPENKSQKEKAK